MIEGKSEADLAAVIVAFAIGAVIGLLVGPSLRAPEHAGCEVPATPTPVEDHQLWRYGV